MAELIKFEVKQMPELAAVGKTIEIDMNEFAKENPLPKFWEQCMTGQIFGSLEKLEGHVYDPSYIGLMYEDEKTKKWYYLVGLLVKPGCAVPEGYTAVPMKASRAAVAWILGKDGDVYQNEHALTEEAIKKNGFRADHDAGWNMELYNKERFTTPDEEGNIIVDYYFPVK